MNFVWFIFSIALSTLVLLLQEWRLLVYFQQEEYLHFRFLKWTVKNFISINIYVFVLASTFLIGAYFFSPPNTWLLFLRIITNVVIGVWVYVYIAKPKKIKLVYTPRLKRLLFVLILFTIGMKFTFDLIWGGGRDFNFLVVLPADVIFCLLCPLIVVLVDLMLSPVEISINRYYLRLAHEKIEKVAPFVIGITGSFGKTSTKEILAHILEGYKSVLATPKSYNTLMGVTKVINTSLQKGHEIFIVEMGAYRSGEIEDICKLVNPSVGIITAVGYQHLERFKTIENIAKAKFELMASLPKSGLAVFSADDAYTNNFINQLSSQSHVLISTLDHPNAQLVASNIKARENGIEFLVENKKIGERALFNTELLGYHNVQNILFASAVALSLGLGLRAISDRVKSLRPVTHRLQLIELPNGVNIIDDAYNSNPVGAKSALDALGLFAGRKILITPGLVELAEMQETENFKLGQYASKICDFVVLVDEKQTLSIYNGLVENKFEAQKVKTVSSIKEGIEFVNSIVHSGDTVLYLNDLPDVYSGKI